MTSKRIRLIDCEEQLARLCTALGRPHGSYRRTEVAGVKGAVVTIPGGWDLDSSSDPRSPGVVVTEMAQEGTGESRPFGDQRRTMREMYDFLRALLWGASLANKHDPECAHCGRSRDDHWCQEIDQVFEYPVPDYE